MFIILGFTLISVVFIIYFANTKAILKYFYTLKYQDQVYKYSNEFNLDPLLIFAIVKVESSYDKYAVSPKGAKGLMQITDKTGIWAAEKLDIKNFSTTNLFDPEINVRLGCWYLNWLKTQYDGNMILAITAYNSGSGRVNEWLKDERLSKTGKTLEKIPFAETDKYVKKVLKEYKVIKYIYTN